MTRIYLPRKKGQPRLETGEVKKVLDAHFGLARPRGEADHPHAGQVRDVFSVDGPWIVYDTLTSSDLRAAAELYWPHGGWEVARGWRADAGGASTATTKPTGPVGPAGRAIANGVPAWLGPNR